MQQCALDADMPTSSASALTTASWLCAATDCLGSQADRHLLAAGLPDAVDIVYGDVGDYVSCKAAMEDIDKVSHA